MLRGKPQSHEAMNVFNDDINKIPHRKDALHAHDHSDVLLEKRVID